MWVKLRGMCLCRGAHKRVGTVPSIHNKCARKDFPCRRLGLLREHVVTCRGHVCGHLWGQAVLASGQWRPGWTPYRTPHLIVIWTQVLILPLHWRLYHLFLYQFIYLSSTYLYLSIYHLSIIYLPIISLSIYLPIMFHLFIYVCIIPIIYLNLYLSSLFTYPTHHVVVHLH